jgi:hypothetical protein
MYMRACAPCDILFRLHAITAAICPFFSYGQWRSLARHNTPLHGNPSYLGYRPDGVGYQGISVINYRSNSRVIGAPRRKRRGFGADRASFMSYLSLQRGAECAARCTTRNHRLAGPSRICFTSRAIITMRQRFAVTLMGSLDTRVSAKAGALAADSRRSESLAALAARIGTIGTIILERSAASAARCKTIFANDE